MTAVIHILPEDLTGGAELAARRAAGADPATTVLFLSGRSPGAPSPRVLSRVGRCPYGPAAVLFALRQAWRQRPDVVVFSLWKSAAAFVAIRLLMPRVRTVVFFHSDRPAHRIDRIVHAVLLRLAHAVWADSSTSLDGRYPAARRRRPSRVVSFVLHRLEATPREAPAPHFVYWGRLDPLKRLGKALDLFARVAGRHQGARFDLIGPDAGALDGLRSRAAELGLGDRVRFHGHRPFSEIAALAAPARFFVQTSVQEGMAMSVVEAMQLGLVPVVTPVGEIARYCRDGENAVIFRDPETAFARIDALLRDPEGYRAASRAAVRTWQDVTLYPEDFAAAARELAGEGRRAGRLGLATKVSESG